MSLTRILQLASHYHFKPQPVAVDRGNEKGRVERAIRYIRDNFFAARAWKNMDDLNAQADQWCLGVSADRKNPEVPSLTVRQAYQQEKETLLALPDDHFNTFEQTQVSARKPPYIRFDLNDYSIPHTEVQKVLTVSADLKRLRILDGQIILATHARSFDKGQQIEQQSHIDALWQSKKEAKRSSGHNRLSQLSPQMDELLTQSVERGHVLKTTVKLLLELLELYGQSEFQGAIKEAMKKQSPYPEGVRQILIRRREEANKPPPIAVAVPEKAKHYSVKPAQLADYDTLNLTSENPQEKPDEK